jgi:hypothetical protein
MAYPALGPNDVFVSDTPEAWAPLHHDVPRCRCFGARIDVLGVFGSGETGIVEIKTGKKVQPTHLIQLDAQVELVVMNKLTTGSERGVLLQLLPDMFRVHDALGTSWPLTQAATEVAQWRLRHDPKARLSEDGPHALRRQDGIRVPGIGTVLGLAGMVDLSSIPPHILANAAERGSLVHEMVELHVSGDLDVGGLPDWLFPYYTQWLEFCRAEAFTPQRAEVPLVYHCEVRL